VRVRDVWNPERRFNPGKLIPVRACMEVRTKPILAPPRSSRAPEPGA